MLRLLASSSRTSARSTVASSKTGARPLASSSKLATGGTRSRSTYTRRVLRRPDELTRAKIQVEAVSGELPSTPSGSPTGFGGSGGGAANGARDAVLTTIFGVIVCECYIIYDEYILLVSSCIFIAAFFRHFIECLKKSIC